MDTLGIWIGLNFLETFLFYYLLFGTVIDRKTLKTKDKWILYFVLIVTSTIISVWVKRSVFSAYGYLLTIFILVFEWTLLSLDFHTFEKDFSVLE